MIIKVQMKSGKPQEFKFDKCQVTIGSSPVCDIVIPENGVSDSHLVITQIGPYFYVQDQGSSQGSFIMDRKLTPGEKHQFATYFPVQIAQGIFIHLGRSSLKNEDTSLVA